MTDSRRPRFRLPHWGWPLLATVLLVVSFVGLSALLPWYREQVLLQKIASWGCYARTETGGPEWLRQLSGIDRLADMKVFDRIVVVRLVRNNVTDAELAQLSGSMSLRRLDLYSTAVTDARIVHLSKLTHLRELKLIDTGVSDTGLPHLYGLKNLRSLYIDPAGITYDGLEKLRQALPDCDIRY